MELQPPRKRAAQASGVATVLLGLLPLGYGMSFMLGLMTVNPWHPIVMAWAAGAIGVGLVLLWLGVRLVRWGSTSAFRAGG